METALNLDLSSKSPIGKIDIEETSEELNDILNEVVNLAKTVVGQKPDLDNMVAGGEEAVDETDFAMQTGDYLELEIDLPTEVTEPQAKMTSVAEETESAHHTLIDIEDEFMDALVKEAEAIDAQVSSSTVTGKDTEYKDTEKGLVKDSNIREETVCDALVENTVSHETYDNLPSYTELSSDDYLVNQESESEVEDVSAPVDEISVPLGSTDQLAAVLSKKIEKTVSRLIEEELSVVVERIVTEKIEGILANIRSAKKNLEQVMPDKNRNYGSCPYCGAVGFGDKEDQLRLASTSNGYLAIICSCGAVGPIRDSEEKAIEAWSKRDYSNRDSSQYPFTKSMRNSSVSLKGNLESFDFPTVLQFLSSTHKNGILHIRHREKIRTIYFKDGKIIGASGGEGLRLGQIAYKKGLISQEQLQLALVDTMKKGRRMGDVLLALDYLKEDSLKEIIRHQIGETVLELSLWEKGDFEYQDCLIEIDERGIEDVNTMRVILEAVVRKDELAAS